MKTEIFNLAICKGSLVAFTYGRLSQKDVMDGLYKYDIQSSDDGFEPAALKPTIHINHWGTLISKVPLPLDKSGWVLFQNASDFSELPLMQLTQDEYLNLSEDVIQTFLNQNNQEEIIHDIH